MYIEIREILLSRQRKKELISLCCTATDIGCLFFTYVKNRFSHNTSHMISTYYNSVLHPNIDGQDNCLCGNKQYNVLPGCSECQPCDRLLILVDNGLLAMSTINYCVCYLGF